MMKWDQRARDSASCSSRFYENWALLKIPKRMKLCVSAGSVLETKLFYPSVSNCNG